MAKLRGWSGSALSQTKMLRSEDFSTPFWEAEWVLGDGAEGRGIDVDVFEFEGEFALRGEAFDVEGAVFVVEVLGVELAVTGEEDGDAVFGGFGDEIDGFGFELGPDFLAEGEGERDKGGEDGVRLDPGEGVRLEPGPERGQRRFEG